MVVASLVGASPADTAVAGWAVPVGSPVYDVDGERVGTLAAADLDHLVVEHGFFFRTYLVPLSAVAAFDGLALRLAVTKEAVRRGEWDVAPRSGGEDRPTPSL